MPPRLPKSSKSSGCLLNDDNVVFGLPQMPRHQRPMRGFTLVELLVVIGIIAVLVGILMPVLGKARTAGKRVACPAQLAGPGRLFQVVPNDPKSHLPCVQTMRSVRPLLPPVSGKPATELLDPYIKESK